MKTVFYLQGKKASKKTIVDHIGEERTKSFIEDAKQGFREDPLQEQSWYIGSPGMLTIDFE